MKTVQVALTVALALGLGALAAGAAQADPQKFDAGKLVGTWSAKEKEKATVEFTKDGKLKMVVDAEGKQLTVDGTYKLDGDKLSVTMRLGDKEKKEDMTVLKLDDKQLVTKDSKGKEESFERKK